jgi:hypothetical protein
MTTTTDPNDPTAMALPVIGDLVRLTDGTEGRVMARSNVRTTAWRVQNGDPFTGMGWSRWVELHEIAGYPEAEAELAAAPCARCGGRNGRHGLVHTRHGNGGGHNEPCPNTPTPAELPSELPAADVVAGVLNAAVNWHAATQAGGSFLGHAAAPDALHAAVRAYLPLVGE